MDTLTSNYYIENFLIMSNSKYILELKERTGLEKQLEVDYKNFSKAYDLVKQGNYFFYIVTPYSEYEIHQKDIENYEIFNKKIIYLNGNKGFKFNVSNKIMDIFPEQLSLIKE